MSGHWNYRMTVQTVDGEEVWAVRELYYRDGAVEMWSQDPDHPQGETQAELHDDMVRYADAVNHPAFDLDTMTWRTAATTAPDAELPDQPELFEPVGTRGRVRCTVCGMRGYPGGSWQVSHRRGHAPCPRCGRMLQVKLDGSARTHTRCPKVP